MIYTKSSSIAEHIQVVFELPASLWADQVFLTGDFNQWVPNDIPLQQECDGSWRVSLDLPQGRRYEFRYVIDGQWSTDFHAGGRVDASSPHETSATRRRLGLALTNHSQHSIQQNDLHAAATTSSPIDTVLPVGIA